MKTPCLLFLGFGAWGGALAIHLARHGIADITAWEYLESLRTTFAQTGRHPSLGDNGLIPENIRITGNIEELSFTPQTIVIIAVASAHAVPTLKKIVNKPKPHACLILSKGLEPDSLSFLNKATQKALNLPASSIFVLSGPTIAKELLSGGPTLAVLAGASGPKRERLRKILERGNFKLQISADAVGAQIGGSMKNIYAIGYGVLDAMGATGNHRAIYLTQAMSEMAQIARKLGGKKETIYGPAGLGDLLTTSLSANSRNSRLGRLLAQGNSLEECQKEIGMVTEGVNACEHYKRLAKKLKLKLPLVSKINEFLKSPTPHKELLLGFN